MAEYPINKGIGRPVEFKGLKAQYLFIFAGGLLAAFVLFVILYMAGAGQWLCIGFGVVSASATVWLTFRLNAKYGEHGLMKLGAARMRPRHVLHRRRVSNLLRRRKTVQASGKRTCSQFPECRLSYVKKKGRNV